MLNYIVGQIDVAGAVVLVAISAAITVVLVIWLTGASQEDKARQFSLKNQELANQREVIELERRNSHEQAMAKIAANMTVQIAQVEGVTIHQDKHEGSV